MLGQPEGKRVHSHPSRSLPDLAADIIADSLCIEDSGTQVTDGIAADHQRVARDIADGLVKASNDLRRSPAAVVKTPARQRR